MDMRALKYFSFAYEAKNFTAAARRAHVAQPSISTVISQLEAELAEPLFVRHKQGVTPTEAARRLYPLAQDMLDRMAAIRGSFERVTSRKPLVIGLQPSLEPQRMEQLFRMFRAEVPELELRLVGLDQPSDLRVLSETERAEAEDFYPLWEEEYVLAVPADHPLSLVPEPGPADLQQVPVIHRDYCEYRLKLEEYGDLSLQIAAVAPSEDWAVSLVAAGIGVAFMPEGCVGDKAGVVVRRLKDVDFSRRVGLALNREKAVPEYLYHLLEAFEG